MLIRGKFEKHGNFRRSIIFLQDIKKLFTFIQQTVSVNFENLLYNWHTFFKIAILLHVLGHYCIRITLSCLFHITNYIYTNCRLWDLFRWVRRSVLKSSFFKVAYCKKLSRLKTWNYQALRITWSHIWQANWIKMNS